MARSAQNVSCTRAGSSACHGSGSGKRVFEWVAFYQTSVFKNERYITKYFGRVKQIRQVQRSELFPNELRNAKTETWYHQIFLGNLEQRDQPIYSRRGRRLVFVPTTWRKFESAIDFNDLFDDSPLEDLLWLALKQHEIQAERQWVARVKRAVYMLDFAIFCEQGQIDVETDGDTYHLGDAKRAAHDNNRNNGLTAAGWQILRFSTGQVREEAAQYCVDQIGQTINRLGGLSEGGIVKRVFKITPQGTADQLRLFEKREKYNASGE